MTPKSDAIYKLSSAEQQVMHKALMKSVKLAPPSAGEPDCIKCSTGRTTAHKSP